MSTDASDQSLEAATRELLAVLRDLEDAVEPPEPRRLLKPPTPRGFIEFTSEVGIPAAILVLRTNVAALELLQRTLRMMGDHEAREDRETPMRDRAADLTATSLSRLDAALADLQGAIDGRSLDRSPDDILAEARRRTEELEAQLQEMDRSTSATSGSGAATEVDVEAELDSLRQTVDEADDGSSGDDAGRTDGTDDDPTGA